LEGLGLYNTRDQLWAKSLSLGLHLSQGQGSNRPA